LLTPLLSSIVLRSSFSEQVFVQHMYANGLNRYPFAYAPLNCPFDQVFYACTEKAVIVVVASDEDAEDDRRGGEEELYGF
ncbi:hypothetical protein PENTCL1PPCAC_27839, partial [Pristionchus entomophagus]